MGIRRWKGKKPKRGKSNKKKETAEAPREGAIFSPELAHTLTGISRHYTMPLLNLHSKGLLRRYQKKKKSAKAQELFHFVRTTGLQKHCSSWLLHRKSNWDNNFRAAVKDLDGELQQTSGKCKQEGATKRGKRVSSWVLKLKTVNYRYQLNLKWISTQFEIKSGYIVEYFYEIIIATKPFLIFNSKCDYILWIATIFCKAWRIFRACS